MFPVTGGDCPSEDELAELVDRGLSIEGSTGIEVHLARCAGCRAALAEIVAAKGANALRSEESLSLDDPMVPTMLGRYALYDKIASGGMGSVHIGRLLGPAGFARTVAIKRMHPHVAEDPQFVSMFLDEARLAARIHHPNVVPTLDIVATTGELFLVMEFIQGESLSHLIRAAKARGEKIPADMVAAIMVGALLGLHAAHEAMSDRGEPLGIVHRDVSPQNILVGTDGVARVLDFGVAKAIDRVHQTTQDGQLKGKLAYMAPEQIGGVVSRATDVYAASVVLYEALTGKGLFAGENGAQTLERILKGCVVPPSHHVSGVLSALDAVTMRGLRVDPAERYSTARDMARALEDAIPLPTASRIGDWVEIAARETLVERSSRIVRIESDSLSRMDRDAPAKAAPLPPRTSSRRRGALLASLAGGLLFSVSVAAVVSRSSTRRSPSARAAPAPLTSPAPPVPSTLSVSPSAQTVATAEASGAPHLTAANPSTVASARTTSARPPSRQQSCIVVTNYDAQGEPYFKKVCK
jgi:eukaryotic-like serine/threonine-protein kinase